MTQPKTWLTPFLPALFVLALALAAGGCAATGAERTGKEWQGHTLKVTVWSGPFLDHFQEAVVKPFEEATGATVLVTGHWGEAPSVILAAPKDDPPYDILFGSSLEYTIARQNDLLLPLRPESIPNAQLIWPPAKGQVPVVDGFGVPFDYGENVLVFLPERLNATGIELESWKDLLRPELDGKVALPRAYWLDNLWTAALIMDDEPGPAEVFTMTDAVFAKAEGLAGQVGFWYEGGADAIAALVQGEVLVASYYAEYVFQPDIYDLGVRAVVPAEGAPGYVDYFSVVRGTKERDLAELFINYALDAGRETAFAALHFTQPLNRNATVPERVAGFYATTDAGWERQLADMPDYWFVADRFTELSDRFLREILRQEPGGS